jgi:ribosomal protein S18 acetylase RimI-like enzyme
MIVREARVEDAGVIARFNAALARETEGRSPDREVLARGVERALRRPDACRYWLAERGGDVVGQAMVTYEWSDWRDGVFWWLQSVYVAPQAREAGVFRRLYDHILALARSDPDARGLRLYVESDNARARAIYERLGMKSTTYLVLEDDWSSSFD